MATKTNWFGAMPSKVISITIRSIAYISMPYEYQLGNLHNNHGL